jgi:hypothetical protein
MRGAMEVAALTALTIVIPYRAIAQGQNHNPVRKIELIAPVPGRAATFPDSGWRRFSALQPYKRAGLRVEFEAPPADTGAWLASIRMVLRTIAKSRRDTIVYGPPSLPAHSCTRPDCSLFYAYGDLGYLSGADTITLDVMRGDSVLAREVLQTSEPASLALGGSIGAAVPLNVAAGEHVVQRAGIHGRLVVTTFQGFPLEIHRFFSDLRLLAGPVLMEGEFLIGVAGVDTSTDTTTNNLAFRQASEGIVRLEFPIVQIGDELSLRYVMDRGFVTIRRQPDFWIQKFYGLRLGIDAADVSGRQSYLEIAWGKSENLDPTAARGVRRRATVQLRVPHTQLVFQILANFGPNRQGTRGANNPAIFSVFAPLDLEQIGDLISGNHR